MIKGVKIEKNIKKAARPYVSSVRIPNQPVGRVIRALTNRPYFFGGNGVNSSEDLDCFGLIVVYYRLRYGVEVLALSDKTDIPILDYNLKLQDKHPQIIEYFKEFLDTFFLKVSVPYIAPGDIVWIGADGQDAAAIYNGSQTMLITTHETGSFIIPTKHYKIKDAYRWLL